MAQIISRLFSSASNAAAAAKDVQDYRFGDNEVYTVEGSAGTSREDLVAQIMQAGVAKTYAAEYAEKVQGGATLVVVHAPFGSAKKATVLLDRHQPLPSAAPPPVGRPMRYDRAAPLSSIFQWRTRYSNAAPLSSFWNLPLLSNFSLSRTWGRPELSDEPAPLSHWLKFRTLSDNATPLSTWLKFPVLRDSSSLTGRNILINNPAPLSSWLNIPVLSGGGPKRRV
jgi:hypothetical protein